MKMKLTLIKDFKILTESDLCDNCSKLDIEQDGICRDCYFKNFTKLLHPDMVAFVKLNKEINLQINQFYFLANDEMHNSLCAECSKKDVSQIGINVLCDTCFMKEIAFVLLREAVSRNNDINKLLEYGESLASAHSSFSLFRCFIELLCLFHVVVSDISTAREFAKDNGKSKGYIRIHPQIQQTAEKWKGNFNAKKPGERELRCLAGEILNSVHPFDTNLLHQQYNDFCLFNHTTMTGMLVWGSHFADDTQIKQTIRSVLFNINHFTGMILYRALHICLCEEAFINIKDDVWVLGDKVEELRKIANCAN